MSESSLTSTGAFPETEDEVDGEIGKPGDNPKTLQGGGDKTLEEERREDEAGSEGDGP